MRVCLLLFLFGGGARDLDDAFDIAMKRATVFYPAMSSFLTVIKRTMSAEELTDRMEAVLSQTVQHFLNSDCAGNLNVSESPSSTTPFRAVISTGTHFERAVSSDYTRKPRMVSFKSTFVVGGKRENVLLGDLGRGN